MITHYEVYVLGATANEVHPPSRETLAQISPDQTEVAARASGVDLFGVYGDIAGRTCMMHVCYHDVSGVGTGPCTEEILWQT